MRGMQRGRGSLIFIEVDNNNAVQRMADGEKPIDEL